MQVDKMINNYLIVMIRPKYNKGCSSASANNRPGILHDDDDFEDDEDDGDISPPQQRNAANARERARMRVLSKAFCRLRMTLPWVPPDTKLSKLDTLRLATSYIAHLRAILRISNEPSSSLIDGNSAHPINLSWPFNNSFYPQSEKFSGSKFMKKSETVDQKATECITNPVTESGPGFNHSNYYLRSNYDPLVNDHYVNSNKNHYYQTNAFNDEMVYKSQQNQNFTL